METGVEAVPIKLWHWGIQHCAGALRAVPEQKSPAGPDANRQRQCDQPGRPVQGALLQQPGNGGRTMV